MAIPLDVNLAIAGYMLKRRLRQPKEKSPLVLMLELTHACNLRCAGCGRVREYETGLERRLSVRSAAVAIAEADTPVVSISGGEPLLHPDVALLAWHCLQRGKVVYLCTNGLLLSKKLSKFRPHSRLFFNVHLDGWHDVHDRLTCREGTLATALDAIREAKSEGFRVTTNTTVYADTPVHSVTRLFRQLARLGVDGFMIAPSFSYEVGTEAKALDQTRAQAWFRELDRIWGSHRLYHTPMYMEFLRGERQMRCVPWGTVTMGPEGWRSPCYLLGDKHFATYAEFIKETKWDEYGPDHNERCMGCMLHSGFETGAMSTLRPSDLPRLAAWQFRG